MARLSSSIQDNLKTDYDVVVVGSGYGGGITASRAARAGKTVCVLERGKEFQPGEYPDTELSACEELQIDVPEKHIGPKTGLYDFRVNEDINVFLGCGLGGTSLVNASVSLRAEPRVFADSVWPKAIQAEAAAIGTSPGNKPMLELGYERAQEMLEPTPYPDSYPPLAKLNAQSDSAKGMGAKFYRPPINVTFEDRTNFAGVQQKKCVKCGDCVTGCNHFAKNTTLMNYLPDAKNWGAKIFTETSVRYVERLEEKWIVHFELLGDGRERFQAPDLFVTAKIVVLAAGTLGSTEILLRSREHGLDVSQQLGKKFSGNGDVLGFAYNAEQDINGIGYGHRDAEHLEPVGPCITGIIDLRTQPQLEAGMVIEEGSIPGALAHLMPAAFEAVASSERATGVAISPRNETTREKIKAEERELESLLLGPYKGAVHNTQTYLVMTHDGADGEMYLDQDRLRIRWPRVGGKSIFQKVGEQLAAANNALRGTFLSNPVWSEFLRHELITVHPLGGCAMADSHLEGVVNERGQVFDTKSKDSVWKGLYVNDGAVIPRSVGVNPLLTISALAERCCMQMAKDYGWTIDYGKKARPVPVETAKLGIQFTERMAGFFSTKIKDDYEKGAEQGEKDFSTLEFVLTIASDDLDSMLSNPQHEAGTAGTVSGPALSAEPITSINGTFNLFVADPTSVDTRNMRYRMRLETEEGNHFFFEGFKVVNDSSLLNAWKQNTTLFVTVYKGDSNSGEVFGKGILTISPKDFSRQLTTVKATNASSLEERVNAVARFGESFGGVLWQSYGGIFSKQNFFNPDAPPRRKRPLRVRAPEVHFFTTSDNQHLKLTRFKGGNLGPVILAHGLGVSSLIFSIDTIETNLVEFLFIHGFDVWLLDYRASIDLPASKTQFSADDIATRDYPAAVAKVRELTGAATVQIVAHCFGSTAFCMAMLAGLEGVRSAVCSQIATHIVPPEATRIKTGLHLPDLLGKLGIRSLSAAAQADEKWLDKLYDHALELYPLRESCHNPVCRRIAFMYAPLYRHAQLDAATHEALHEMFGVAGIKAFEHLGRMTQAGHVVDFAGREAYLPNLKRLAIPISFIHGAENQCFLPESTRISYELLRKENGTDLYERHVIPGYGHIDCIFGKNAAVDVFPYVVDHLEATGKG